MDLRAALKTAGFNEAGADAPEIHAAAARAAPSDRASMRPGRMPRKYRKEEYVDKLGDPASMRPGRMPRKYRGRLTLMAVGKGGFNEAGADAPEIPRGREVGRRRAGRLQ